MEASKEETPKKTEEKTDNKEGEKYSGGEIPKVAPAEKKNV
jgi:hypothetical protein